MSSETKFTSVTTSSNIYTTKKENKMNRFRYDDIDWGFVLRALIDATQSRRIRWQVDSRMQRPDATSVIYRGAYKGFNIVLFKFAVDIPDESSAGDLEDVCILIVDEDGKELFRLPADSQRWQLLKLVQYEAADISTFIEDLLRRTARNPFWLWSWFRPGRRRMASESEVKTARAAYLQRMQDRSR